MWGVVQGTQPCPSTCPTKPRWSPLKQQVQRVHPRPSCCIDCRGAERSTVQLPHFPVNELQAAGAPTDLRANPIVLLLSGGPPSRPWRPPAALVPRPLRLLALAGHVVIVRVVYYPLQPPPLPLALLLLALLPAPRLLALLPASRLLPLLPALVCRPLRAGAAAGPSKGLQGGLLPARRAARGATRGGSCARLALLEWQRAKHAGWLGLGAVEGVRRDGGEASQSSQPLALALQLGVLDGARLKASRALQRPEAGCLR